MTDDQMVRISRWCTVAFGIIQINIGIAAEHLAEPVVSGALAIAGFSAGLLLGVFCLGVLTRRVRQPAALCGLIVGLIVLLVVKFVWPNLPPKFAVTVAWPWFAVIGSLSTFLAGYAASWILPQEDSNDRKVQG